MATTACRAGSVENAWHGQYRYFAAAGETAGGSPIMMDITLKIGQPGKENCELHADGYQTQDRIRCTAITDKNRLTLQFKSYPDGSIVNPIGVEEYKVGEILFSLEPATAKTKQKQNRYLVRWGAYTPFEAERKNLKYYFEKVK